MSDQYEASEQPSTPPESASVKPHLKSEADTWLELAKTLVYALLIALGIRTVLVQPFNIPTGSMEATLLVGDYLFVEKFAYGYSRFSIPFGYKLPSFGRILPREPTRGDVVVFKWPNDTSIDYIKRLIGLPGDHIQMRDGTLFINDKEVPKVPVEDYIEQTDAGPNVVKRYKETLPNGVTYMTLDRYDSAADTTEEFVVPAGHYFMMGDNRDNSSDSRVDPRDGGVGYVPAENLVGKAEVRFFSIDNSAVWYKPWTWPMAVRFRRMFTLID